MTARQEVRGGSTDQHVGQVAWSLLSLVTTLGVVIGIPVALMVFVGWPLPEEVPTWRAFLDSLEQQGITVEVLVKALAVVVWLAWFPLTWAILVETLAAARGRAARQVRAWPGAQYVARKLVASATLLLSSVGAVRHAGAAQLDPLVVAGAEEAGDEALPADLYGFDGGQVIDLGRGDGPTGTGAEDGRPPAMAPSGWRAGVTFSADGERAGGQPTASDARESAASSSSTGPTGDPEVLHQVEHGDSFWALAEEYLGNGMRWREIRDHNVGRVVAAGQVLAAGEDHLQDGWRILIPLEGVSLAGTGSAPMSVAGTRPAEATGVAGDAPSVPDAPATAELGDDSEPAESVDTGAAAREITVQPGDHFWGLAEQQLEQAWGRPVSAEEVAPYWNQFIAENLDRIASGDPDLINPAEQFTAPAPPPPPGSAPLPEAPTEDATDQPEADGSATDTPQDAEADASPAGPPVSTAPEAEGGQDESADSAPPGEASEDPAASSEASDDSAAANGATGDTRPPTEASDDTRPPTEASDDTRPPTEASDDVTAEVEESLADAVDDEEAADEDDPSEIPLVVPFGASAALAGLLLVALNRRRFSRRRQLRPGQVIGRRPQEDAELEREFALGARDVLATVEAASRGYGAVLAGNPHLPPVTGLVVSPARDAVVHLAEPAVPEIPFERGPASTQWDLYLDELDLDPEFGPGPDVSASVLDTPAVIGRTEEGDWVLLDLESVGALEIEGDREVASDLVRSIVAELSMAPQAERMVDITVVGVDGLSPDVLEQGVVSFDRLDEDLVRRVERVAAETDSVQPHRGASARAMGLPRDGLFVMVVALGGAATPDPVLLERLAAAATPGGRGIAIVAVGTLGPGATRVLVDGSGDAHIPHMGLSVDAVQLGAEDLRRVERLLAEEPEVFPPPPPEAVPESWPEWPDEWSSELAREAPGGWMGAWLPANGAGAATRAHRSDDVADAEPVDAEPADASSLAADAVAPEWVESLAADESAAAGEYVDEGDQAAEADRTADDVEPTATGTPASATERTGAADPSAEAHSPGATEGEPADAEHPGEDSAEPADAEPTDDTGHRPDVDDDLLYVDTIEADDLDDRAPNSAYGASGTETADAAPPLAPVPPLPEVDLPPVDTPERPPEPEPLDLRDEPRWPDPGALAVSGGPPDVRDDRGDQADRLQVYSPPPWELCVRIFADHIVESADGVRMSFRYGENPDVPNKNTHRGPELLSYLALSGRAATAEEVQDHMWWDRPIALSTVNKLVYGTRKVLGGAELLSHAQEDPLGRYRLAPTITTDAQLLAHGLEYAQAVANHSPEAARDVLRPHLAGIEAVAFRNGHLGQGLMEWGAAYRVIDAVELPVIEAALLFSRLSCERGRAGYFDALWGVDQGLRACPYNEALVRVAMEIEAMLGNTDAVNHRFLSLATKLARDELEPEPETSDLRVRLGGTSRLRSAG